MARCYKNAFLKKHAIFIWLMLCGFTLRILFIEHQGLSNDELSAWFRTRYVDWDSFWNLGVKTGDMHPFFYQAFLKYWVTLFGDSEFSLRATGLLFYASNSLLIYRICNRFFSKNTGLGIIALYSCLTFTIINTTLARPYNSGTFFLLLLFLSIVEINRSSKKITSWHIGVIVGFLGAMLSHYFAFLTAGVIGCIGLIYVQKNRKIDLLLCGLLAIISFIPHWPITQYQLNAGGLGWLPPPKLNWLIDFTHLFFNNSWGIALFCALIFGLLFYKTESKLRTPEEKFSFSIFIFTYVAAHFISLFYTPILRELVMLYLLPFLFIFIFRRFQLISVKKTSIFFVSFPVILGVLSISYGHLLQPKNFSVFREIGVKINETDKKIGRKNCTIASNYNNVEYLNYYLESPIHESISDWSKQDVVYQLSDRARTSKLNFFLYTCSNSFQLPMYYEVIQKYFPYTENQESYFGSAFRLYSKNGQRKLKEQKGLLKKTHRIKSSAEFIGESKIDLKTILARIEPEHYILLKATGILSATSPVYFVAAIERNDKEILLYQAYDQAKLHEIGKPSDFFMAFAIPEGIIPSDVLKIYFWNPERQKIEVERSRIYFIKE